jgi:hypothetical protein
MNLLTALTRKSIRVAQSRIEPFAEGSMNSLVLITRRGIYNADEGEYDPTAEVAVYDDPDLPGTGARAAVTSTSSSGTYEFGDEPTYTDSISVKIPRGSMRPRIDDVVRVIAGPDQNLTGRYFRVVGVPAGGVLMPSIQLSCTGVAPSKQWNAS